MPQHVERVNRRLAAHVERLRKAAAGRHRLADAIAYALLGAGKRVRPLLVYAAGRLAGAEAERLDAAAAAVEMIHCYSLIHDDLPAMDDDELRRGKPTLHLAYDEATAILAGDALLTEAFAVLADGAMEPAMQLHGIRLLAGASGAAGMVAGQALDMSLEGARPAAGELETMFALKTGALLHASTMLGVLGGDCGPESDVYRVADCFGRNIGLCFQIRDDILDVTAATEQLGKPQGSDARRGKPNYALVCGLDKARNRVGTLYREALAALSGYGAEADPLRHIGELIARRDH